jgi:16S rRNA processing protein RimM
MTGARTRTATHAQGANRLAGMLFSDTVLIGKAVKHRPTKGDVQINLKGITADMFGGDFLIADIDSLKVPFRVTDIEERGNCMFATLDEAQGNYSNIVGCDIYARKEDIEGIDSERATLNPELLTGFTVTDAKAGKIGTISSVDTSTPNTVIYIGSGEHETLVPLAEDFIEDFDFDRRTLKLRLPEGLVDINRKQTPGNNE